MLLYLIHYKQKDKYQYNINEVQGELKDRIIMLIEDKITDKVKLRDILNNITKKYITNEAQLLGYCIDKDYLEILKKYSYILVSSIRVYNKKEDEEK